MAEQLASSQKMAVSIPTPSLQKMKQLILDNHYTHSVPAGKSHYISVESAVVVFSIPANPYIAKFLLGRCGSVWELSRLWAPNEHRANLLTEAIKISVAIMKKLEPGIEALVSYADPNVGHTGGVYRAASWAYLGQCEESRNYEDSAGRRYARRKFHSGVHHKTKDEIKSLGFTEVKLPGKLRFARGLTEQARRHICTLASRHTATGSLEQYVGRNAPPAKAESIYRHAQQTSTPTQEKIAVPPDTNSFMIPDKLKDWTTQVSSCGPRSASNPNCTNCGHDSLDHLAGPCEFIKWIAGHPEYRCMCSRFCTR